MEDKFKVADNWECAKALDRFKQLKIDALQKRIDVGNKYIASEKFDILTEVKKKKSRDQLGELREELFEMKKMYDAVHTLVKRHESVIDKIAMIYIDFKDGMLCKGKFPKELFDEQMKIMDECYISLQEILKPCKLDEVK